MEPSIFTRIIRGEIPSFKIYEDDKTLAFLDINPSQPGHTLVVPKNQVEFLWDLPDEDYQSLMNTVKKVGYNMRAKLNVKYVGIKVIGEEVPHAHVHLVPFNEGSQYFARRPTLSNTDTDALTKMAKILNMQDV